ncbi:hypothetical protein G7009_07955 [Pseudomonas capeferrum]|uniref:hypothetical protein n=1 Tax=Pseudomonas capeferrum TaxID=1495066 RepID=UPI0015E4659E|nr:hypothetical protein [Pseudomonas capeferrum]MBA1201694.1 hypothetical protein [Pseudomonas capeferrum]
MHGIDMEVIPRPDHVADYTGKQRGKMTAIAWCRASRSGKGTVWLCRCNCGLYEYRRPGTWAARPYLDDMCSVCRHAQGPNARQTAPERLQRWIDGLRSLGLADAGIARIQVLGIRVKTRDKTVIEIREQIANALREEQPNASAPFNRPEARPDTN